MDQVDPHVEGFSTLRHYFVNEATLGETLQRVVDLVTAAVPAAAYAGVSMIVEDVVATAFFSDPEVPEIDQAQYESGKGPCLDAFRHGVTYLILDTETDTTWPEFSAGCVARGLRSTLSVPLLVAGRGVGALNLYASAVDGFSDADREAVEVFAAQAAVVLANSQAYWDARSFAEDMRRAMESRATIEQAKGILMAESKVGPDAAFDLLRLASQRENRKVRDIAEDLVKRHSGGGHRTTPA